MTNSMNSPPLAAHRKLEAAWLVAMRDRCRELAKVKTYDEMVKATCKDDGYTYSTIRTSAFPTRPACPASMANLFEKAIATATLDTREKRTVASGTNLFQLLTWSFEPENKTVCR